MASGLKISQSFDGSGLRYQLRAIIHLSRFIIYFFIYRSFKRYLSSGNWKYRQKLFHKYLILIAGGLAVYGSYQFFAQRFNWPLANINNLHHAGDFITVHYFEELRGVFYVIFATFGEPKTYAGFLLAIIPLLLGNLLIKKNTINLFHIKISSFVLRLLIIILTIHFFLTFSRTGFAVFIFVIIFTLFFLNKKIGFASIGITMIFFLFLSKLINKSPLNVGNQFVASLWNPRGTVAANLLRWQVALDELKKSPILGNGLGTEFTPTTIEFTVRRVWMGAPGVLGYLLPGLGILGTVIFLVFLIYHIRKSFIALRKMRINNNLRLLLFFSLISVVAAWGKCLVHFSFNAPWPWIILAQNAALYRIAFNEDKREIKERI